MSLKELQLPSIASLRAIAALKSTHLALVRPARIGLGFESGGAHQKTLAEIEEQLGGPGRLSLPYSLRWLLDVLTGLGVLHRTLGFVHGEVQPEHIVLGEDGVGRLVPVVRAHWVRGEQRSPERLYYLSPEKLLGDSTDVRSDVFSVGVMLWEALVGQRLLEAYDVDDIISRLMGGGIPRAQAPEGEAWTLPLADVAARAIAVDPARRFASVAEMKEAIEGTCLRYLANAPGMAELFEDPSRRARNRVRDSVAPDSQRITLPPDQLENTVVRTIANEAELDAAAERLSRSSFVDLEEELTTKPQAAPLPTVTKGKHIQTLLGVPPPFVERESGPPDEPTMPFARIPVPSTPPLVIHPASSPAPARKTTPAPSAPPAAEPRRAASLAPLVAAPPGPRLPVAEPSFELVRPRKRRGALWLILGAAAAIGLFAARPWLARQVAATTGALPDNGSTPNVDTAHNTPAEPAPSAAPSAPPAASSAALAVGIASTPPSPSTQPAPRVQGAPPEEHLVIHDTVEPAIRELAHPAPVEHKPEPVTTPPPTPPPPAPQAPPPAPPKPKQVPVSDADRYGI